MAPSVNPKYLVTLDVVLNRRVGVLPKLYQAVLFMFYGQHTIAPQVTFVKDLGTVE